MLEEYRATDRRVYNGAYCSDMKKEHDHTEYLTERMLTADKTAWCTYFPVEGKFLVFTNSNMLRNPDLVGPPRELTGVFHHSRQAALIEAIKILESDSTR